MPEGTLKVTRFISKLGNKVGKKGFGYTPFSADYYVRDEFDLTEFNSDIKFLSTPGHSLGSVSILVDREIAVVGDVLFGVAEDSVCPPYADDVPEMVKNWRKLADTGCRLFLPGHGTEIKRERLHKEFAKYVKLQEADTKKIQFSI